MLRLIKENGTRGKKKINGKCIRVPDDMYENLVEVFVFPPKRFV